MDSLPLASRRAVLGALDGSICVHPEYLAYGAGGMPVLAIGFKLGSAMRG